MLKSIKKWNHTENSAKSYSTDLFQSSLFHLHPSREFFFCFRIRWILKRNYSKKSFIEMNDYKFVKVRYFCTISSGSLALETIFSRLCCGKFRLILERKKKVVSCPLFEWNGCFKSCLFVCFVSCLLPLPSRSPSDFIAIESAVDVFISICGLIESNEEVINRFKLVAGLMFKGLG